MADWSRDRGTFFYIGMAWLGVAAVLIGFSTTYFLPVASGVFAGPLVAHVHGLLFFAWVALALIQPWLIRRRRWALHRTLGWAALPLALAMAASGMAMATYVVRRDLTAGMGDAAYSSILGVATTMTILIAFTGIALSLRRRADWHKRMIFLASVAILWPAWFRFRHLMPWAPRPDILFAILCADAPILIAAVRDRLRFGRIHPAYLVFGTLLVVDHVTEATFYDLPGWRMAARALFDTLSEARI